MKPVSTAQKLRGGYYTPPFLADFLAGWAVRKPTDRVVEPSSGDGEVLTSLALVLEGLGVSARGLREQIIGCELDADEAQKSRDRLSALGLGATVSSGDFFSEFDRLAAAGPFQAVVGNPPFVRYQTFPEEHRERAFALMRQAGLNPSRLTNAWVAFIVASARLLDDSGRLAMVVPAELLQVGYAGELRRFLSDTFGRILIYTFGKRIFDVQQEVVLLCAEKDRGDAAHGIHIVEVGDPAHLATQQADPSQYKALDHDTEKWTRYFLSKGELRLIRRLEEDERIPRLGALAEVDVGIVTGMNEVFVLNKDQAETSDSTKLTIPIVTKSAHLEGLHFTRDDWASLDKQRAQVRLLNLTGVAATALPSALRKYFREAEQNGLHEGYKCRIRDPWWAVPSVWTPDAFMLRQIHRYPKIVLNSSKATSTDTVHRVRVKKGVDKQQLCAAAFTSLTFAFSELLGRSYGGGVLELEPGEAELLPVAYANGMELSLDRADEQLRKGDLNGVLSATDDAVLKNGLKLKSSEIVMLQAIWSKLRDRRHSRRERSALPGRQLALRRAAVA